MHQAQANARFFANQGHWWSQMPGADRLAAVNELFHRIGKDYEKPEWGINEIDVDGERVPIVVHEEVSKPFCKLLRFKRHSNEADQLHTMLNQPFVLVVAPLSGHHATLLRDTVRTLLRDHRVYVTDWVDARMVPASEGEFGLDDYIAYIQEFIRHLGVERLHVVSVCQPTVPVLAAVSLMASRGEPTPRTLVMMGGPIDARCSPTAVNNLATQNPLSWFENNVIHTVPASYPGAGRRVYPGFLQHAGFLSMNPSRHFSSHWDFYTDLVRATWKTPTRTVVSRRVQRGAGHAGQVLPRYHPRGVPGLPAAAWRVGGQRREGRSVGNPRYRAAEHRRRAGRHRRPWSDRSRAGMCTGITADRREHFIVEGAGHYGIFSGRRWRGWCTRRCATSSPRMPKPLRRRPRRRATSPVAAQGGVTRLWRVPTLVGTP